MLSDGKRDYAHILMRLLRRAAKMARIAILVQRPAIIVDLSVETGFARPMAFHVKP